jgi:hypothetical protein
LQTTSLVTFFATLENFFDSLIAHIKKVDIFYQ